MEQIAPANHVLGECKVPSVNLSENGNHEGGRPRVSVIIPVYNDFQRLEVCLDALARQTYPSASTEVLVVDNGSEENWTAPKGRFSLDLKVLQEPKKGSYAARNLGLSSATGEILAFTDSDCIPDTNWLQAGVAALAAQRKASMIGGCVRNALLNPSNPGLAELYDSVVAFPQEYYVEKVHFAVTANLFAHRELFDVVGPFDANLESGGDTEWGIRAHRLSFPQGYARDAVVSHPVRGSFGEIFRKQKRIAAGQFDKAGLGEVSILRFLGHLLWDLRPPLIRFAKIWRGKPVQSPLHKVMFTAIAYYLRFINIITKARLRIHR